MRNASMHLRPILTLRAHFDQFFSVGMQPSPMSTRCFSSYLAMMLQGYICTVYPVQVVLWIWFMARETPSPGTVGADVPAHVPIPYTLVVCKVEIVTNSPIGEEGHRLKSFWRPVVGFTREYRDRVYHCTHLVSCPSTRVETDRALR